MESAEQLPGIIRILHLVLCLCLIFLISEYSVTLDFTVSSLHSNVMRDLRCKYHMDRMVYSLITNILKYFNLGLR